MHCSGQPHARLCKLATIKHTRAKNRDDTAKGYRGCVFGPWVSSRGGPYSVASEYNDTPRPFVIYNLATGIPSRRTLPTVTILCSFSPTAQCSGQPSLYWVLPNWLSRSLSRNDGMISPSSMSGSRSQMVGNSMALLPLSIRWTCVLAWSRAKWMNSSPLCTRSAIPLTRGKNPFYVIRHNLY